MNGNNLDIRWEQRLLNYRKALVKLSKAVQILRPLVDCTEDLDDIDELQREGLIHRFEYTQELAWQVMADYAKYQGYQDIKGSRDAFRYALKNNLIDSADWMKTIIDRNRTSHTYNETTAQEVMSDIIHIYHDLFLKFEKTMEELRAGYAQQSLF